LRDFSLSFGNAYIDKAEIKDPDVRIYHGKKGEQTPLRFLSKLSGRKEA
jgi:hypothetical protein